MAVSKSHGWAPAFAGMTTKVASISQVLPHLASPSRSGEGTSHAAMQHHLQHEFRTEEGEHQHDHPEQGEVYRPGAAPARNGPTDQQNPEHDPGDHRQCRLLD